MSTRVLRAVAMAPVAELAASMNRPVIGWISSDPALGNKTVYSTLVRLLWPITYIGKYTYTDYTDYTARFHHNHWVSNCFYIGFFLSEINWVR